MLSREELIERAERLLISAMANMHDPDSAQTQVANELKAAEICIKLSENSTYRSLRNMEMMNKLREYSKMKAEEQAHG